jgi:hypothetical protein
MLRAAKRFKLRASGRRDGGERFGVMQHAAHEPAADFGKP